MKCSRLNRARDDILVYEAPTSRPEITEITVLVDPKERSQFFRCLQKQIDVQKFFLFRFLEFVVNESQIGSISYEGLVSYWQYQSLFLDLLRTTEDFAPSGFKVGVCGYKNTVLEIVEIKVPLFTFTFPLLFCLTN